MPRVDSSSGTAGVVIDHGTGQRIPFVRWYDSDTGEYEAIRVASNGVDYACDDKWKPITYRAKAVGRLELVPWNDAVKVGLIPEPKKVKDERPNIREGLETYQKLFVEVWQFRGESRRVVDERFDTYLRQNNFLDHLILRRRPVTTTIP